MKIPPLGVVRADDEFDMHRSRLIAVPLFSGAKMRFEIEHYVDDEAKEDFHKSIRAFLSLEPNRLNRVTKFLREYCKDYLPEWQMDTVDAGPISMPKDIWPHVQMGNSATVIRRAYGDKAVYVSISGNCDWEPEHGLQIVFRRGSQLCKVGPYDGHMTNSDAYADDNLERTVYSCR